MQAFFCGFTQFPKTGSWTKLLNNIKSSVLGLEEKLAKEKEEKPYKGIWKIHLLSLGQNWQLCGYVEQTEKQEEGWPSFKYHWTEIA